VTAQAASSREPGRDADADATARTESRHHQEASMLRCARSLDHLAVLTTLAVAGCGAIDGTPDLADQAEAITIDPSAAYNIIGVQSGKCIDVVGASTASAATLEIATCNGTTHQQFRAEAVSGGFRLRNVNSNLCADVTGASTTDGAAVIQFACGTGTNQVWSIADVATGVERLTASHSGKVLDVTAHDTADGALLEQWTSNGGTNQQFRMQVTSGGGAGSGVRVSGNHLVANGATVRLLGVNHSGSEYQCIHNNGIFDGPVDQASVSAILTWHANAVRVPLNEDCWLAINGAPAAFSGTNYRNAITQYVDLLRQNGLFVIVELHWNAPGTLQATGQLPMPDADHSPVFWTSVAGTFKGDQGIVFDLYNEPFTTDWNCWLNGCQITGSAAGNYTAAGIQQLITTVRATGAQNLIMAGGIAFANDVSGWLSHRPSDPAGNLAASFHVYNFNVCNSTACWSSSVGPLAAQVPVITGEIGENDNASGFITGYMAFADGLGLSYLGWAWNTNSNPSLISNANGTATSFGAGLRAHLLVVHP
jgi:hypothetical protein